MQISRCSSGSLVQSSKVREQERRRRVSDLVLPSGDEKTIDVLSRWGKRLRGLDMVEESGSKGSSSPASSLNRLRSSLAARIIFLNFLLRVAHIRAREIFASQYLQMPQHRPEISSLRSGFLSLDSIQVSNGAGILGTTNGSDWLSGPSEFDSKDIDKMDCDSVSVCSFMGTLYD
jgi:hypothetical protein